MYSSGGRQKSAAEVICEEEDEGDSDPDSEPTEDCKFKNAPFEGVR